MATFDELCKEETIYKCDKCPGTFKAKDIKLEKASTNIEILTPMSPLMFISKDGKIKGGNISAEEGDRIMLCPHCGNSHIFGFDRA